MMKRTRIALAFTATVAMLGVAACGSGSNDPLAAGGSASKAATSTIVVGSANFPESALLAEIYAGALGAKGVTVQKKLNIGSRETYIPALKDGSIDLIPEYTGVLDQYFNKNATATTSDAVYAELTAAVPATMTVLAKSAAEDKDAVVVTQKTAAKYGLKSIADLGPLAKNLTLGGPPDRGSRPEEGLQPGLQDLPSPRCRGPAVGPGAQERSGRRGQPLHHRPISCRERFRHPG